MKKYIAKQRRGQLLSGLCAFLLMSGTALAATTSDNTSPLTTPADTSQTTTLSDRISQRKNTLKLQLSSERSQRIIKNCTNAQTRLKNINTKDKTSADKREEVYTDLATRLNTLIRRMEIQGTDVTELKTAQARFNSAINQYLSDMQTYRTAMGDVAAVDCKTDPAGFGATLTTARQLRTKLSGDVAQIKALKSTLTQALTNSKNALSRENNSSKAEASQ